MKEFLDKRFLKAVFLGGPVLVAALFSVLTILALVGSNAPLWQPLAVGVLTAALLLLALRLTGLWGSWGIMGLFILGPIAAIIDISINPIAPAGVILFSAIYLLIFGPKNRSETNG